MPVETETRQRPAHETILADALAVPAQLLAELNRDRVLAILASALPLSRRGGYTAGPLIAFAITYLLAQTGLGMRPFWNAYKRQLKRAAAVAGYISLPSSGSVSRALGKIGIDQAHAFADVALSAPTGLKQVLSHRSVVHRDSRGKPLHVVDIDPTVQAFRMRDLVESDDHPEPDRLAPGVPGYTGQYRGEVRIRHIAACHAGTGTWLGYRISDDNPHLATLFTAVLSQALGVLSAANVPTEQILVRGDAEFGSAGVAKAIVALGVQLLVRISRYRLLDRPEIQRTLRRARWQKVSSGGRRAREAAELGQVMLHPSAKSADAGTDGILLRVVVARRKVETTTVPYGTLRDGYQYELFATTLSADAWSASDVVELYAGRSAIENRYAQEDRELDLGRTFSYQPGGQAVFTAIGLFLWNYWTCAGFLASKPPEVPEPCPRPEVPGPEVLAEPPPLEPALEAAPAESPIQEPAPTDLASPSSSTAPTTADPTDPFPLATAHEREPVVAVLRSAYQDMLRVSGWSLDPAGFLRCPNDKRLFPFAIARVGPGRNHPQIMVRTDVGACDGCPVRAGCFSSTRPNMYKQVSRAIPAQAVQTIAAFIAMHPPARRPRLVPSRPPRAHPAPEPTFPELVRPPPEATIGPWACSVPSFQAAAARHRARAQYADVGVEIRIRHRRPRPQPYDPRRARRTWAQRDARWELTGFVRLIRTTACRPPKRCAGPAV